MPLADTREAIGAVTQLLHDRLLAVLSGVPVDVIGGVSIGRPDAPRGSVPNPRLNLFLYQLEFDGNLRNVPPDPSRPTPLWLVLRYLLTAFDTDNESDTIGAQQVLGSGIRALNDMNFAGLFADAIGPLQDNPDRLKISFDRADPELISKLTQSSDGGGHFRLSAVFQVRPVMVASARPSDASLLVGIDYEAQASIGEDGIRIPVLPSLGPRIDALAPEVFEVGDQVEIRGMDLDATGLLVVLGGESMPVTGQRPDWLRFRVPDAVAGGRRVGAGSHALAVVQELASGRRRSSNLLVGGLRPQLASAQPHGIQRRDPLVSDSAVHGNIDLQGVLMGTATDDVQVTLYRAATGGRTEIRRSFDRFVEVPSPPAPTPPPHTPQTRMRIAIPPDASIPQALYRTILRVNGQQARNSPEVDLRLP